MRESLVKSWIIGLALLLLGGCSSLRLAFDNGPQLSWWWLDGYVDFSRAQSPRVKTALDRWFDWVRATQLPAGAALLAAAAAEAQEPTTPERSCRWQQQFRDLAEPALERALQQAAEIAPTLGEAQWQHLEQRFLKRNDEMRDDFLQPDLQERLQQSVKRAVERAEMLYGDLDEPQRRVIAAGVAASPFDPALWLRERERRQRDTVSTLRRLATERADRDTAFAALRVLVERVERSPDPAYRAYQQRLADYNCGFIARLHNATTPAQRQRARDKLKGWEDDLRALNAPPS